MIEVEIKAYVEEGIDDRIIQDKIEKEAEFVRKEIQIDRYFNAPHRDLSLTDEALRIRKYENEDLSILTYKGPKIDPLSKTRVEYETVIGDPEKMEIILEKLGFNHVFTIMKERKIYKINNFWINYDNVHELGRFLEIETKVSKEEDLEKARNEIIKIFKKFGIDESSFERKSYLELFFEKLKN